MSQHDYERREERVRESLEAVKKILTRKENEEDMNEGRQRDRENSGKIDCQTSM